MKTDESTISYLEQIDTIAGVIENSMTDDKYYKLIEIFRIFNQKNKVHILEKG
jgi:hypothetical protein